MFEHITYFDFLAAFLGVLIRFLSTMLAKVKERGFDFEIKKYFDLRHLLRWSTHIIVSICAIFVIPEVFIEVISPKYFPNVGSWTLFGSAFVGFVGYDLIKFFEKITLSKLKKTGLLDSDKKTNDGSN